MSRHNHPLSVDNKLKIGITLNLLFTAVKFVVGILAGSLALISDAAHSLTDTLSLVISLFGSRYSNKKADEDHSYGHGRATILAALLNSVLLIGATVYIFIEAVARLMHPEPVAGGIVAITAFIGILVSGYIASLMNDDKSDLNIKSAFLHMLYDALSSVGVLIAGIIILLTGKTIVDPVISILIGLLLLYSTWEVIQDALHILLEGIPKGIDPDKVKEIIKQTNKIKAVDDLHIWAISSYYAALSCHIVIENCDLNESTRIVQHIKDKLKQKFQIEHATIEPELVECPPDKN